MCTVSASDPLIALLKMRDLTKLDTGRMTNKAPETVLQKQKTNTSNSCIGVFFCTNVARHFSADKNVAPIPIIGAKLAI